MNMDFTEKLKCVLDELKEKTVLELTGKDSHYKDLSSQHHLAEQQYLSSNLSKEEKAVVDNLLSITDSCLMEYSTINYLAGLIDGQKFAPLISLSPEIPSDNRQAIRNFYYNILQPCAECYESQETLEFWKSLEEEDETFSSTLSADHCAIFKQLSEKRNEGLGYTAADAFIYGFRSCTQLIKLIAE